MKPYFTGIPLDGDPRVTGAYNQSTAPWTPEKPHKGIDYSAVEGTPIYYRGIRPAKVGEVYHEPRGDFGIHCRLLLDEEEDMWTVYAHMSDISALLMPGVSIEPGSWLGRVGHTGKATGDHLHWQCYTNGPWASPHLSVDPMELIGEPMPDPINSILVMERDLRRLINGPHPTVPLLHKYLREIASTPSLLHGMPSIDFEYQGDYKEVGL